MSDNTGTLENGPDPSEAGLAADPTGQADQTDQAADQVGSAEGAEHRAPASGDESGSTDSTDGTDSTDDTNVSIAAVDATAADAADANEVKGAAETSEPGEDAEANEAAEAGSKSEKSGRVRQLEREGEVAADFLETLLDIADLDGDIDVDVDGDRAAVAIVDSEEGQVPRRLVGPEGKVLEALQELTRLAVQAETGERSRLMLDVAGHRAQRRAALVEVAATMIAEVKESGTKQSLEPMSAFERKVVHDEVAAAGLTSESEGVEPRRHVVILP